MTRWSPDTCECVVEYDDNIVVTAVLNKCVKHAATPDDPTHFALMLTHNRKKNKIYEAAKAHLAGLGFDAAILGVYVNYDPQDGLVITNTGLSVAQRAALVAKPAVVALLNGTPLTIVS